MKKILLFLLLIPIFLSAKTEFNYRLDKPTHLYVGTPFHLKLSFKTGLQDSIFSPKIDTLDIFVLRKISQQDEIKDTIKITNVDLDFAPFDTGTYDFPKLEFTVKTKNDSLETFETPVYKITVESVIADTTKSVTDIKGPIKLRFSALEIIAPILLLALLILLIIYLIKRRKGEKILPKVKKKIVPVYIQALEMIKKLQNKKLPENGKYLEYFFELSYILRYLLEGYYKINAIEMTTSEIKNALPKVENRSQILALLNFADKVKFAKFVPNYEDSKKFESWLWDYINDIKVKEERKKLENTGEK